MNFTKQEAEEISLPLYSFYGNVEKGQTPNPLQQAI